MLMIYLGGLFLLHALFFCPWLPVTLTLLFVGLPRQSAQFFLFIICHGFSKDHIHVLPTFFAFLPLLWPTTDLHRALGASGLQQRVSPQRLSLLALSIAYIRVTRGPQSSICRVHSSILRLKGGIPEPADLVGHSFGRARYHHSVDSLLGPR